MGKHKNTHQPMTLLGRAGNFLIKRFGDGRQTWIRISSVSGGWRMDFSDDTIKYAWILLCLASDSEGVHKALESWILVLYQTSFCNPDPEFLNASCDNLFALDQRAVKARLEEEKKALAEAKGKEATPADAEEESEAE